MDFRDTPEEAAFRDEVRTWLSENLVGEFARIGGGRGTADEEHWDTRLEWERKLGEAGWIGLSWPEEYGGRGATFGQQAIFSEEYAKANAPGRITFFGEGLLGPTLVALGSDAQKRRFLPGILKATELWCQGYSEPDAGSDLANVKTKAVLDGDEWVITGQKVWTTFAHHADWCFVITRTDFDAPAHAGISYILVPMDQPGVTYRPLRQMTGAGEFNEVFFDEARTEPLKPPRSTTSGMVAQPARRHPMTPGAPPSWMTASIGSGCVARNFSVSDLIVAFTNAPEISPAVLMPGQFFTPAL